MLHHIRADDDVNRINDRGRDGHERADQLSADGADGERRAKERKQERDDLDPRDLFVQENGGENRNEERI